MSNICAKSKMDSKAHFWTQRLKNWNHIFPMIFRFSRWIETFSIKGHFWRDVENNKKNWISNGQAFKLYFLLLEPKIFLMSEMIDVINVINVIFLYFWKI